MARHFVAASSQYLTRSGVPGSVTVYPITLSVWVRASASLANNAFAGALCNGPSSGIVMTGKGGAGMPEAYAFGTTASSTADATVGFPVDTWAHLCAVVTSAGLSCYLNGANKGVTSAAQTFPTLDRVLVGAFYVGGSLFTTMWDGDLAEFAIYTAALNDAEVALLAAGTPASAVRAANLAAYYPLLGTTSPEPDVQGGTGLTLVNGPTPAPHPPLLASAGGRMFQVF